MNNEWMKVCALQSRKNSAAGRGRERNLGIVDIPKPRLTFGPLEYGRFWDKHKPLIFDEK